MFNKYIPISLLPKQLAFIMLPHMEALYGGQAGGGKSEALLALALQYVHVPGYSVAVFRKTLTDLMLPNSLLDRCHRWLSDHDDAKYDGSNHCYTFPTRWPDGSKAPDSKVTFCYIGADSNAFSRYKSAEFQTIIFDELTQHNEADYTYMFSRMRRNVCPTHKLDDKGKPVWKDTCKFCKMLRNAPIRMRAATNPGDVGHGWVRARFKIEPEDGRELRDIREDDTTVKWVGRDKERPFIQASYLDNPYIDQEGYGASLDNLSPAERARLKYGNWAVNASSRFKRQWAKYYSTRGDYFALGMDGRGPVYPSNELLRVFGTVDCAGSTAEGQAEETVYKRDPSYTVISIWGLTKDYNLLWLDMLRFREEIPQVVANIEEMYHKWRPAYIKIESNGLGLGIFQYCEVKGIPVIPLRKSKDKVVNSTTAQVRMQGGRIWFPQSSPWLAEAEDEIFNWIGDPKQHADIIDTLSDAANDVLWEAGNDVTTQKPSRVHLPFIYKL